VVLGPRGVTVAFLAVVLLLAGPASTPRSSLSEPAPTAQEAPVVAAVAPTIPLAAPALLPSASVSGPVLASGSANVLVDAPCNASSNAEVQQAFDAVVGILYETWIGCGGIGFARSTDGGTSFDPAFTVPGSTPNNGSSWDPSIALGANGTVYVAFMVDVPGYAPVVAWSWDHGQSFSGSALAFAPSPAEFSDRDFLAVAPNGTLYLTWDYSPDASQDFIRCVAGGSCYFTNGDYNIVCASSADGGSTWSAPVAVNPEYPAGGAIAAPLLVEPNGSIAVLYEDYAISGPTHSLGVGYNYFTRSADGGRTWSPPVAVSNHSFLNSTWWIDGALARDVSGTLYATFDASSSTSDTAWLSSSVDGGSTWTELRLNPDTNAAAHVMVTAVGAEGGNTYVAWLANNSTFGWSAYEAAVGVHGTVLGPITVVSQSYGIPGYWIGDTLGLTYLGRGNVAVSWSYGVNQSGVPSSQVFEAVVAEPVPGAPTISGFAPGIAMATVSWTPPTTPPPVSGYLVEWGLETGLTSNLTVGATNLTATIAPLMAFAHYAVAVAAFNDAGTGPLSAMLPFTLFAWTAVGGSVSPSNATVQVDGVRVPVFAGQFFLNTTYAPHLVSASARDFGSAALAVTAVWNGTAWANFSLSLLPGVVEGYLTPVTADLTWDGVSIPVAGNGFYQVSSAAGTPHDLAATYPGLVPFGTTLAVTANTTVWVNITLKEPNGTLNLTVSPSNAVATVNGTAVVLDSSGHVNVSLPAGRYAYNVSLSLYSPQEGNVTIVSGEATNLSVALVLLPGPPGRNTSGDTRAGLSDPLILGLIAGVVVVLAAIAVLAIRRGRPPTPPPDVEVAEAEPVEETTEPPRDVEPPDPDGVR